MAARRAGKPGTAVEASPTPNRTRDGGAPVAFASARTGPITTRSSATNSYALMAVLSLSPKLRQDLGSKRFDEAPLIAIDLVQLQFLKAERDELAEPVHVLLQARRD